MAKRKIIEIDRDLCDGCGLCTTACAEGALALDDEDKAVLVREIFCDGMGVCLDVCPTGALRIVEREGEGYDATAAYRHVLATRGADAAQQVHGAAGNATGSHAAGTAHPAPAPGSCPGARAFEIAPRAPIASAEGGAAQPSALSQWPIQLHLVSPLAPYFKHADLLVAADCTAFSLGGFHQALLAGKKLVIACPKLDNLEGYVEKLADIIRHNDLSSLTVAVMTVPCCSGLLRMVELAVERSGVTIDIDKVVVGIDGQIVT